MAQAWVLIQVLNTKILYIHCVHAEQQHQIHQCESLASSNVHNQCSRIHPSLFLIGWPLPVVGCYFVYVCVCMCVWWWTEPQQVSHVQVRGLILRALVNFLLLPWPSFVVDHKLDTRKHHLTSFINSFTSDIRKLDVQRLADDKSMQESCECFPQETILCKVIVVLELECLL